MSETHTGLNRPPRPWPYRVLDVVLVFAVLVVIAAVLFPVFAKCR